jgi:predicted nicotinamide N-methyase
MFSFDFAPVPSTISVRTPPPVCLEVIAIGDLQHYSESVRTERGMQLDCIPVIHYLRAPKVPSLEEGTGGELRDIVQGRYYGGLKVWSCARDVCSFVSARSATFCSKKVLEIGCGQGLCGIMALLCGASHVTFHDYNSEVLEICTKPNVFFNCAKEIEGTVAFYSGDWDEFAVAENQKYDVVLGSDVTYDVMSCQKVCCLLSRVLSSGGAAVLGMKEFYFGTNGGRDEFEGALAQVLPHATVTASEVQIEGGMKRVILVIQQ